MELSSPQPLVIKHTVTVSDPPVAVDCLAQLTGLSKRALKGAMVKGAVWLRRRGRQRLRRATAALRSGDRLELYFDPQLLAIEPPDAVLLHDAGRYSFWFKAAGVLAQGTDYGDHVALLRQVEQRVAPQRQALLVHRLDREARGVMVIAHDGKSAARLSELFQQQRIKKRYRILVAGDFQLQGSEGRIELPLDGKRACTEYVVRRYETTTNTTLVDVELHSGRLHQIRRHFAALGFPVMGDPRYGHNNHDARGLQLVAHSLGFTCPFTARPIMVELPEDLSGI